MINDSPKEVRAYWFFTFNTVPDEELLHMLNAETHEIALHVVNHPYKELAFLEKAARRSIKYFTIHGTSRLLGRILWRRWAAKTPKISKDFPLQSFHQFPTFPLDSFCYTHGIAKTVEIAEGSISREKILEIHPEWLLQRGTLNHRGPYYSAFRRILNIDKEFRSLAINKKLFFRIGRDTKEYQKDIYPTEKYIEKIRSIDADIFTFIERKWIKPIRNPPRNWIKTEDNVALLHITSYDEWWRKIGKKTRNMVRKANKNGVTTKVTAIDKELMAGIWKIYNETPIRQRQAFPHYGVTLETVKRRILASKNSRFIGAYIENELVGFIQLVHGDNIAIISQILSLQKQWDKALNNALLAKAIEVSANQQVKWLMYGRIGNHPSLDRFKQNHGFVRFALTRFFVPLTTKGKIAVKLGLHKEFKDALPQSIKDVLIPIYNWASRTKRKMKASNTRIRLG